MNIYLVRHGKADSGSNDDLRALREDGRTAIERLATALAQAGVTVDRIEHSTLTRARETAEILAYRLGAPTIEADLRYDSSVEEAWSRLLNDQIESVMLVGHNPFMERLAGRLITGDEEQTVLTFGTGTAAKLVSATVGPLPRFICEWLIRAEVLPRPSNRES